METNNIEPGIDYDTIQAPQFVDFQNLTSAAEEANLPYEFFELQISDENRQSLASAGKDDSKEEGEIRSDDESISSIPLPPGDPIVEKKFSNEGGKRNLICNNELEGSEKRKESGIQVAAICCAAAPPIADTNVISGTIQIQNGLSADEDSLRTDAVGHIAQASLGHIAQSESTDATTNVVEPKGTGTKIPRRPFSSPAGGKAAGTTISKKIEATLPVPFHFAAVRPKPLPGEKKEPTALAKPRVGPMKAFPILPSVGVSKPKPIVKRTVPISPRFASDERIRSRQMRLTISKVTTPGRREVKENVEPGHEPRGRAVECSAIRERRFRSLTPNRHEVGVPVKEHKVTVMKPFSFEEREKERKRAKEAKIQKEIDERLAMEEKKAQQELRKKIAHQAAFKAGHVFEVKHSERALTSPKSPAFKLLPSQRRNLHQIHENEQHN